MRIACYFLNLALFAQMIIHSTIINIGALIMAIAICKIIYMVMIFMLKVLTIDDLKGYIKK